MSTADTRNTPRTEPTGRATTGHTLRRIGGLLYRAAVQWQRDNAMRLSAAVAMYTILSLSPLLVITIKVTGLVLGEQAATQQVERQVQGLLGPQGAEAVAGMIVDATRPGSGVVATLVSLAILLFTASGVFVELRDSLNSVWGVAPEKGRGRWAAVRDRFQTMGMVFVVGFLLLVSQFVATALLVLSEYVVGGSGWVAVVVDLVVSTAITAALFAILFRYLPDARISWGDVALGAVVTAVLFKVGQYVQALYFTYVSTGSVYGAAASFVVVLLWVYYSCWIFFYGAELTQVYATRFGDPIEPAAGARRVPRGGDPGNAPADQSPADRS
jgi:membrane protein